MLESNESIRLSVLREGQNTVESLTGFVFNISHLESDVHLHVAKPNGRLKDNRWNCHPETSLKSVSMSMQLVLLQLISINLLT